MRKSRWLAATIDGREFAPNEETGEGVAAIAEPLRAGDLIRHGCFPITSQEAA
jgi:hypothetical protein